MMDERRIVGIERELQRLRAQMSEIPVRFPSPGSKGIGSEIQQFRFRSQQANWITCRTWDGEAEGANDVLVAKPWELRPFVFSGRTYSIDSLTRIRYDYQGNNDSRVLVNERLSSGTWSEQSRSTERVYQPWDLQTVGAQDKGLIYAFKPVGGTSEEDGDGNAIVWQDANVGARYWRADAGAAGWIAGWVTAMQENSMSVRVVAGAPAGQTVTVAKHPLCRFNTPLAPGIVYDEFDIPNSIRRAVRESDETTRYEGITPPFRPGITHTGQYIIAVNVGSGVTGVPGANYLDVSPRFWGQLPFGV